MKKPSGYPAVSPYLICQNAPAVIEFLKKVFHAKELRVYKHDDGSIMHAEVQIEESVVMIGSAGSNWPAIPSHLHVYVNDVDATYQQALAAGGKSVQEPVVKGDADKRGGVMDAGGNTWWIATQVS